jgi:hypothetical protein
MYKDPTGHFIVQIPFTEKYLYVQQKPETNTPQDPRINDPKKNEIDVLGYRIGLTSKKEGRYVDPAPEGLFSKKQMSMINDEPNRPSPDKKVAFEAAELVEGSVKNTKQTININSSKRSGPLYPGYQGKHGTGEAFDINYVNGRGVGESSNLPEVKKLQDELSDRKKHPNYEFTRGPAKNPDAQHLTHIHVQSRRGENSKGSSLVDKISEFVFPSN